MTGVALGFTALPTPTADVRRSRTNPVQRGIGKQGSRPPIPHWMGTAFDDIEQSASGLWHRGARQGPARPPPGPASTASPVARHRGALREPAPRIKSLNGQPLAHCPVFLRTLAEALRRQEDPGAMARHCAHPGRGRRSSRAGRVRAGAVEAGGLKADAHAPASQLRAHPAG